jgi:hypothetical protein
MWGVKARDTNTCVFSIEQSAYVLEQNACLTLQGPGAQPQLHRFLAEPTVVEINGYAASVPHVFQLCCECKIR